jgi:hypothetical protein
MGGLTASIPSGHAARSRQVLATVARSRSARTSGQRSSLVEAFLKALADLALVDRTFTAESSAARATSPWGRVVRLAAALGVERQTS